MKTLSVVFSWTTAWETHVRDILTIQLFKFPCNSGNISGNRILAWQCKLLAHRCIAEFNSFSYLSSLHVTCVLFSPHLFLLQTSETVLLTPGMWHQDPAGWPKELRCAGNLGISISCTADLVGSTAQPTLCKWWQGVAQLRLAMNSLLLLLFSKNLDDNLSFFLKMYF